MTEEWLSTAEASALAGITPASFRREVNRNPDLQQVRRMRDARTPEYPESVIRDWIANRPGRGARSDLRDQSP